MLIIDVTIKVDVLKYIFLLSLSIFFFVCKYEKCTINFHHSLNIDQLILTSCLVEFMYVFDEKIILCTHIKHTMSNIKQDINELINYSQTKQYGNTITEISLKKF